MQDIRLQEHPRGGGFVLLGVCGVACPFFIDAISNRHFLVRGPLSL